MSWILSKAPYLQPICPVFCQKSHTSSQNALCCIKRAISCSQNAVCCIKRAIPPATMPRVVSCTDNWQQGVFRYKKKIESIVRKPAKTEEEESASPCPYCAVSYICVCMYIYIYIYIMHVYPYQYPCKDWRGRKCLPLPLMRGLNLHFIYMYVFEKYVCTYINVYTYTCVYMCR